MKRQQKLAAEALVNDFFFEARVSAEFFDGNELMFQLIKMRFYFSQEGAAIAITFACEALDILGVDSQPFHCHSATILVFSLKRRTCADFGGKNGRSDEILFISEKINPPHPWPS